MNKIFKLIDIEIRKKTGLDICSKVLPASGSIFDGALYIVSVEKNKTAIYRLREPSDYEVDLSPIAYIQKQEDFDVINLTKPERKFLKNLFTEALSKVSVFVQLRIKKKHYFFQLMRGGQNSEFVKVRFGHYGCITFFANSDMINNVGEKFFSSYMTTLQKYEKQILEKHDYIIKKSKKINGNVKKGLKRKEKRKEEQHIVDENIFISKNGESKREIRIYVTKKCNQKCIFCCVNKGSCFDTSEIKRHVEKIFKKVGGEKCETVVALTGGEPTLNSSLIEIVKFIKKFKVDRIVLQTNGVKLSNNKYFQKIIDAGVDSIFLSFHSHKEFLYNKLTNSSEQFNEVVKAIGNIVKMPKIGFRVNIVLTKINYRGIDQYVEFQASENDSLH
jgi:organic radical activating enzyme